MPSRLFVSMSGMCSSSQSTRRIGEPKRGVCAVAGELYRTTGKRANVAERKASPRSKFGEASYQPRAARFSRLASSLASSRAIMSVTLAMVP